MFFIILVKLLKFKGRVAQWIRVCGYEPQGRGFKSLHAQFKLFYKKIVFFIGI
jgi:hypothetical protein